MTSVTADQPTHPAFFCFSVAAGRFRNSVNVYLWESEKSARAFFTPELAERVKGLYGVPACIEFAEVAALVDNATAPVG
ncbi:MAG TPA: hypothetical protein VFI53_22085 [Myxococcaceae bacterium]|nr:hypothetical protein [Myxococcaceae bacterium]